MKFNPVIAKIVPADFGVIKYVVGIILVPTMFGISPKRVSVRTCPDNPFHPTSLPKSSAKSVRNSPPYSP